MKINPTFSETALKGLSLVILNCKIILDCLAMILLFSSWLYVTNDGHFSTWSTLNAFYTFVVMFIFNTIFNTTVARTYIPLNIRLV